MKYIFQHLSVFVLISLAFYSCRKGKDQIKTDEISSRILVFSNPKGQIEPCGCNANPEGGVEKLPDLINKSRPDLILVFGALESDKKADKPKAVLLKKVLKEQKFLFVDELSEGFSEISAGIGFWKPGATADIDKAKNFKGIVFSRLERSKSSWPIRDPSLSFVDVWLDDKSFPDRTPEPLKTGDALPLALSVKDRLQQAYLIKYQRKAGAKREISYVLSKNEIERSVKVFDQKIERFIAQGADKTELGKKLIAELKIEKASLVSRSLSDHSIELELFSLDNAFASSPELSDLKSSFFKDLNQKYYAEYTIPAENCDISKDSKNYAGMGKCKVCHQPAYDFWTETSHSKAFDTLKERHREFDPECISCHSAGMGEPGGFCDFKSAKPFVNVQCESCHGPQLEHSLNPVGVKPEPIGESSCLKCHNSEHSKDFDYSTYLPRILGKGHGKDK